MENDFSILCGNLRYLRVSGNLTQKKMAELLHISIGAVRQLEKGEMPPRLGINFIGYVYCHFGVSPGKLFGSSLFKEPGTTAQNWELRM